MNRIWSRYYIPLLFITTSLLSSDAINTSQIVSDNNDDTMTSSRGIYELGFFSLENSNSRYVGIWLKRAAPRTVLWVANRDRPLTDTSGILRLTESGRLVLLNATNATIWSTNASIGVRNPVAELLDSGNLVVKDANDDNPQNFIWQSFDYPTDTFLPGMKLGKNFVTGKEVCITSWKTSSDPAAGAFTFAFDTTGYPQLVIKKGPNVTYRLGPWNGVGFSGLPHVPVKDNTSILVAVISKEEAYYYFEVHGDHSVIRRYTLGVNGAGREWTWTDQTQGWIGALLLPVDDCDSYGVCGPNSICNITNTFICECLDKFRPYDSRTWTLGETSQGCNRSTALNCEKGDAFLKYPGIKLPDTRGSWFNQTMNLKECEVTCLRNCSCTAYASLDIRDGGKGCLLWFGDLMDVRKMPPGQEIYIRIALSDLDILIESEVRKEKSGNSKGRKREIIIVAVSLVIGISLLCLSLLLYSWRRKKRDHQLQQTVAGGLRLKYADNHPQESHKDLELPQFELSTIIKATDNFAMNNKLGQGGFGPVYKGLLEEGQEIAVKRLSRTSHQGINEFRNEVICYAKLQHRNLVKLLGCCIQGDEIMLVYEYMKNGSLDLVLFDPTKCISLEWPLRFNIINGIARGLLYLHQDSHLRVIHRDLKLSNILLDSNMNPKISDFGLARTVGGNETGANTSRVVGTYGYMSPEYAGQGLFSVKSDVFSFGVMVVEIVSGERNRGFLHRDYPGLNLLGHAWMLYKEEKSWELVDTCIRNPCYLQEIVRSIQIGLLCVQENPEDRPSMSSVVRMLTNDTVLPEAKHPGFFIGRDAQKNETSTSSSSGSSRNKMTTSLIDGR